MDINELSILKKTKSTTKTAFHKFIKSFIKNIENKSKEEVEEEFIELILREYQKENFLSNHTDLLKEYIAFDYIESLHLNFNYETKILEVKLIGFDEKTDEFDIPLGYQKTHVPTKYSFLNDFYRIGIEINEETEICNEEIEHLFVKLVIDIYENAKISIKELRITNSHLDERLIKLFLIQFHHTLSNIILE